MQRPCGVKQPGESEELNIKQGNSGDEGREAAGGGGGEEMPEDSSSCTECVCFKCNGEPPMGLKEGGGEIGHIFLKDHHVHCRNGLGEGTRGLAYREVQLGKRMVVGTGYQECQRAKAGPFLLHNELLLSFVIRDVLNY